MGDRVWASLTVPLSRADKTRELLEDAFGDVEEEYSEKLTTTFSDFSVNYGEFGMEGDLRELGIPYRKTWSAGGDFGEGEETFCPGDDPEVVTLYGDEELHYREFMRHLADIESGKTTAAKVAEEYSKLIDRPTPGDYEDGFADMRPLP